MKKLLVLLFLALLANPCLAQSSDAPERELVEVLKLGMPLQKVYDLVDDIPSSLKDTVWEGEIKPRVKLLWIGQTKMYGLPGLLAVTFDRKGLATAISWRRGEVSELNFSEALFERASLSEIVAKTSVDDFQIITENLDSWLGKHKTLSIPDEGQYMSLWEFKKTKQRATLDRNENGDLNFMYYKEK